MSSKHVDKRGFKVVRVNEATENRRFVRLKGEKMQNMNTMTCINSGMELAAKGDLSAAAEAFRRAIELDAACFEAHNNLALTLREMGCLTEAQECILCAIGLKPDCAAAYNNLGIIRKDDKCLVEAISAFRRAIELDPNYPEAYNNLGIALSETKRWDEAAACFTQAAALQPSNAGTYFNLGSAMVNLRRPGDAVRSFSRAVALNPGYVAAHFNLGVVQTSLKRPQEAARAFSRVIELNPGHPAAYYNLGLVLIELKKPGEAIDAFRRAVELNPLYFEAYNNLGIVLRLAGRLGEAEAVLRCAIELRRNDAKPYKNLALVLKDAYRLPEAEECLRLSISLNPKDYEACHNLALILKDTDRLPEAELFLQQALALNPDFVEAGFAWGFVCLLQEQYEKGWAKYVEWREHHEAKYRIYDAFRSKCPDWRGESLAGRKILLYSDQGFGDTIQFIRYAQLVAAASTETGIWVHEPLQRLMALAAHDCGLLAEKSITADQFDFCCPLSSLPFLFRTHKDTIPLGIPYIRPASDKVRVWGERLDRLDGGQRLRVGVVWAGNPKHENDRNRSIAFHVFNALFDVDSVSWVSLQEGERARDLQGTAFPVTDISRELVDFAETAAVVDNVDLVITVDSAVAHLAGAMGKPTWLLLPYNPDWRWQRNREDSPWYPTMRLFRQPGGGRWPEVLLQVKTVLKDEIPHYSPRRA